MPELTKQLLDQYRAQTYQSLPRLRVKTNDEAVDFVNRRGFVFFWPIKGVLLPSSVGGCRR
jgi:hypothetical protein